MSLPLALVGFQLNFLALLLGAGTVYEPYACAVAALWVLWQATHWSRTRHDRALAFMTILVGPLADACLAFSGLVAYENYWFDSGVPAWIFLLWACFGLGLRQPFGWLMRRGAWFCWPTVAIGAPLAYLAGERLGAAELTAPLPLTLCAISLSWLLVFLTLKLVAEQVHFRAWTGGPAHQSGDSR